MISQYHLFKRYEQTHIYKNTMESVATASTHPMLFDFDGVILRNSVIQKIVETKAAKYVEKKLKLSSNNGVNLNKILYTHYGHTALGVAKLLEVDYKHIVQEFNDIVYKDFRYEFLMKEHLNFDDYERVHNLNNGLDIIKAEGLQDVYTCGLYTNAPMEWCENTLAFMGYDVYDLFDKNQCFTSDNGYLKPHKDSYTFVENRQEEMGWTPELSPPIHFIDDSLKNLLPVMNNDNWKITWMSEDEPTVLHSLIEKEIHKTTNV